MTKISRRGVLRGSAAFVAGAIAWRKDLVARFAAPERFQTAPQLKFPTAARERLSVASWPFRAEIDSATNEYRDKKRPGMDLRDFAVKVREQFGVPGVEPLSVHFPSTDERYLKGFREEIEKAGVHVVNIPVDNSVSFYDADAATRKKAVEHGMKWVDIAVTLGSPSVRTSIAEAKNSKPNVDAAAESLRRLVDYAATKNILVNLENDDLVSEDAFFVVKVIEKVNHPYLHALPDFCNSMASGNEKFNYDAVTAMFQHAYNICHVKDSEVGDEGKVFRVDLKKTFDILNASHYKGYCSMEWEGPEDPYVGTKRLIAASLQYLA
ncbi:MAG TPA: sugar phosphate isomerase/epimerase family protein [Candidatus Acidoferrum sp.]|nr:sugar phosphate isomerase/epimerase family protein [Candidatus Acidoferrum sp.]